MSKQDKPENCNQASDEAHYEFRSGQSGSWAGELAFAFEGPSILSGRLESATPEFHTTRWELGIQESDPRALTRFGLSRDVSR